MKIHIEKVLELGALESKKQLFELKKVDFTPILERICEDFKQLSTLDDYYLVIHLLKDTKYHNQNESLLLLKSS